MLQFILSGARGGKTTRITELIKDYSADPGRRITLIVPEQYSFTSEKNVLAYTEARKKANIDVLSFTRLGEKLVDESNFFRKKRLSDAASAVLMSLALEQNADKLELYGRQAGRKSAVNEFLSLISEFKQNGVSPDRLREVATETDSGLLSAKLRDIALIADAYDALVNERYFSPDDLLTELCAGAALDSYFEGRAVFIDSFRGFTAKELEVIGRILSSAEAVYIALCTRDLENCDDVTDLFAKTKNTAARITAIARKNGVRIAKPQLLSAKSKYNNFPPEIKRYRSPELEYIESQLFLDGSVTYDDPCENVTLCRASDIFSECRYAASAIKKLIREDGYRCRDIAVIARDISAYEMPLHSEIRKCGLDIFEDSRRPVDVSPVINAVSAAAAAAAGNYETDQLMRFLKTGLTDLSSQEISELENYCLMWRINRGKWLEDWSLNPSGFGVKTDDDIERLNELNRLRLMTVAPIEKFRNALKYGTDGHDAVAALWAFIEDTHINENLKKTAAALRADGEEAIVSELDRMWNLLIETLDELDLLTSGRKMTAKRLSETLDLMFSVKTVGSIPPGLDEITIGSADRVRLNSPKVAFILGANDGIFPDETPRSSALTLKERAIIEEYGITLSDSGEWRIADEKIIVYNSLCCASEKLFISCSCNSESGDELTPCEFYNKILSSFSQIRELDAQSLDDLYYTQGKQTAFEQFALSRDEVFRASAKEYFASDRLYDGRMSALERVRKGRNFKFADKNTAAEFFGKNMHVSASKLEQYYRCAFSYFCKYGLGIYPNKTAELDGMQRGTVIHYVMEHILKDHGRDELSEMSERDVRLAVNGYMKDCLVNMYGGSRPDDRVLYAYDKLKDSVCKVVMRLIEEFSHTDFVPVDFELPIGYNGEIMPYTLSDESGKVSIEGVVDRVDLAEDGGKTWFRIIDYKSSGKAFKLTDVINGMNLQMLIYLLALSANGGSRYGKKILPAGLLYYTASAPYVSVNRNASDEEIKKEEQKSGKMNGIVLEDPRIIQLMEHEAGGVFIPASIDPKGKLSGSFISAKALNGLKKRVDALILNMADELREGNIDALPAKEVTTCNFCDYKSVCGFEDDIPVRPFDNTDEKSLKLLLEQEGEEGAQ